MSYHTIVIVGRLTRDPELRYTPNAKAVATLSLAVDDGWGENKKTIWMRVSVWDKQAENVHSYLKKGRQVLVEGRLQADRETGNPRVFQRQDGSRGASYEITANVVRFLGGRDEGGAGGMEELPGDNFDADAGDSSDIPF